MRKTAYEWKKERLKSKEWFREVIKFHPATLMRPFSLVSLFYAMVGGVMAMYLATYIDKYPFIATKGIFASVFIVFGISVKLSVGIKPNTVAPAPESINWGIYAYIGVITIDILFLGILASRSGASATNVPVEITVIFVLTMAIAEEFFFTMIYDVFEQFIPPETIYDKLLVNILVSFAFASYHKSVYGTNLALLFTIFLGRIIMNIAYEKGGIDASLICHTMINLTASISTLLK